MLRQSKPRPIIAPHSQMTNELPKIMADIAAEIEAKEGLSQGAQDGAGYAQGGQEHRGNHDLGAVPSRLNGSHLTLSQYSVKSKID